MPVYEMTAYPKTLELDGESITVMPLRAEHESALLDFFLRVSEEDRFYLKEDVTSPRVISRWISELDYDRALPLLAVNEAGQVVADGTLMRSRAGARKHIGEVRIVVDPRYRQHGIGSAVIRELAEIAHETGLEKLVAEVVDAPRSRAIATMQALGFVQIATLPNHAKDVAGRPCDIVISELSLGRWSEWWQMRR